MKKFLLVVLLSSFASAALADSVTCNQFGNTRTCQGYVDGRYVTQTCTYYGNTETCNTY